MTNSEARRQALEKARQFLITIDGSTVTDRADLSPGATPETLRKIARQIDATKVLAEIGRALGLNIIQMPRS